MMTDEAKDRSEGIDNAFAGVMGYDKWPKETIAFHRARNALSVKYLKDRKNGKSDLDSVVAEFRAIETEYLVHVGDDEEIAQDVRRIIAGMIFEAAWYLDEPFETCQRYWNEVVELGYWGIDRQAAMTGSFAVCCSEYGQTDLGLATLDPLIAELERLRAEPAVTQQAAEYYDYELDSLRKLRARLEAERAPG
jgi:hypothetical protein